MKAYLCMNPVKLESDFGEVLRPPECLHLLAVYKTKTAARKVSGKNAVLVAVELRDEKEVEGK